MDFVERLLHSKGFDFVFVVVDRLNKCAHFIPLSHPYSAKMVASEFVKEVVHHHEYIVSNRDKIFLHHFLMELFLLQGTQLKRSAAYHPQTDGQTEVVNKCLELHLRCYCSEKLKSWSEHLPWVELWYNTTYHASIKTTPNAVVYGRPFPRSYLMDTLIRW